ncbi:hypothetical protein CRUP_003418 [Coryphaenoides rupestris]|nr:hypothetical protein CRUP_003418 [Coryphaenoides rupestris]
MEGYGGPPVTGSVVFGPGAVPFLPHHRGGGGPWAKRDGRFMTPRGGLSYLDLCKVILSQVAPTSVHQGHPRVKKAIDTKECGVQVNAKVDKVVQCSLGAKTLYSLGAQTVYSQPREKVRDRSPPKVPCNTPVNNVRFSRPLSIYSPVFDRRSFLKSASCSSSSEEGGRDGGREGESTGKVGEKDVVGTEKDASVDFGNSLHQEFKGSNFQVYYKQLCRKCQMGLNPYKVESILCQVNDCLQTSCCCESKQRRINMKRPHRQDLCCRCKGTRLSCDATYSFKYIM